MPTIAEWTTGALPTTQGASVSLDSASGYPTADSILMQQQSGQVCRVRWGVAVPAVSVRWYFKTPDAWAGSSAFIAYMSNGATLATGIALAGTGAPGQVRLGNNGGDTARSPNSTVTFSTWYRLELALDTANSRARCAVFPIESDTALWESGWQTHADYATVPSDLSIGRNNATPTLGTFSVDSILATDQVGSYLGRIAGDGTSTPGRVATIWDGTQEIPAVVTIWNGTQEVPASLGVA